MHLQDLLSDLTDGDSQTGSAQQYKADSNTHDALNSLIPGRLAGTAAAGVLMAMLVGSKSSRKVAKKVAGYGGAAVLGGLAYKAFRNWQQSKALGQTQPLTDADINRASGVIPQQLGTDRGNGHQASLEMVFISAMIAASKADGQIDSQEQKRIHDAMAKLALDNNDKAAVFDAMVRDVTVRELAESVTLDEHKAEVYLAAYLAIEVDNQAERGFLNKLAMALDLPRGLPAYLEQQADAGVLS